MLHAGPAEIKKGCALHKMDLLKFYSAMQIFFFNVVTNIFWLSISPYARCLFAECFEENFAEELKTVFN